MDLLPFEYEHAGTRLVGRLALPEGPGPHPAVMVMHDARGLGGIVLERARRLAELGYVALATDMYGDGAYFANPREGGHIMVDLHGNPEKLRERVLSAFKALGHRADVDASRIAAIGFCFGGECVLDLARSGAAVKAVVSYHGLLTTALPARPEAVKAQVAVYTGAKDPYAPPEHVEAFGREMDAAAARWQLMVFSGVYHSFTDPGAFAAMPEVPGLGYDPIADQVSWAGTTALLRQVFA